MCGDLLVATDKIWIRITGDASDVSSVTRGGFDGIRSSFKVMRANARRHSATEVKSPVVLFSRKTLKKSAGFTTSRCVVDESIGEEDENNDNEEGRSTYTGLGCGRNIFFRPGVEGHTAVQFLCFPLCSYSTSESL